MSLSLTLPQEVLLLALHDEKGRVAFGSLVGHGIAGAILTELVLRDRIVVEGEGGRAAPRVTDAAPTGDPILDGALARLAEEKPRSLRARARRPSPDGPPGG